MQNDKINTDNNLPAKTNIPDWKSFGFDSSMRRVTEGQMPAIDVKRPGYIAGVNFDALLDEMTFNRVLRLKNLPTAPQGNEPGKMYWDPTSNKYKLWVNKTVGFVDVQYTSTSTSTTSSSSSSSSTSSSSTSSTSTTHT